VFQASLEGAWRPQHLGLEQLLKHALALNSHAGGRTTHLVYVYWEPANGSDVSEVVIHRAEVAELARSLGNALPRFHALSYDDLLDDWLSIPDGVNGSAEHVDRLQARYGNIRL
jgi:hypothetical protein